MKLMEGLELGKKINDFHEVRRIGEKRPLFYVSNYIVNNANATVECSPSAVIPNNQIYLDSLSGGECSISFSGNVEIENEEVRITADYISFHDVTTCLTSGDEGPIMVKKFEMSNVYGSDFNFDTLEKIRNSFSARNTRKIQANISAYDFKMNYASAYAENLITDRITFDAPSCEINGVTFDVYSELLFKAGKSIKLKNIENLYKISAQNEKSTTLESVGELNIVGVDRLDIYNETQRLKVYLNSQVVEMNIKGDFLLEGSGLSSISGKIDATGDLKIFPTLGATLMDSYIEAKSLSVKGLGVIANSSLIFFDNKADIALEQLSMNNSTVTISDFGDINKLAFSDCECENLAILDGNHWTVDGGPHGKIGKLSMKYCKLKNGGVAGESVVRGDNDTSLELCNFNGQTLYTFNGCKAYNCEFEPQEFENKQFFSRSEMRSSVFRRDAEVFDSVVENSTVDASKILNVKKCENSYAMHSMLENIDLVTSKNAYKEIIKDAVLVEDKEINAKAPVGDIQIQSKKSYKDIEL